MPGPWNYRAEETSSLAWMLGEIVERYDLIAGGEFPYMMFLYASPKGEEECFHFHVEFYPPATPEQKIPPNVSVERGMWLHLLEASLEEAAERMRTVKD